MKHAVFLLTCCTLFAGCYSRQPLDTLTPVPAARIVAGVTDAGAVSMGNLIGAGAMEVEGIVSSATDTAWSIHLVRVDHRDGRTAAWNRELVHFPRAALSNPQVVVLDRRRSWLLAGATIAGSLLAARLFNVFGADSDDRGQGPPPPAENVVPGRHE